MVSPFEAPAEARRLLGPGEPADGLQRTARPPRWPRPLASSFSPASYPSKSSGRAAPDPIGAPGAKLSGEEKGAESEERGRAKSRPPSAFSGNLNYYQSPAPGRRITKAPHCLVNNQLRWGNRVQRPSLGKGRLFWFLCFFCFFLAHVPSTPSRVPPSQPSAHFRSSGSWWPSLVLRHGPLRSSLPRHHSRDCVVKAPAELPFLLRALRARPLS